MMEKFYNNLVLLLNRSFSGEYMFGNEVRRRGWYLTGSTLAHFIANYTIKGCGNIHVEVAGSLDIFQEFSKRSLYIVTDNTVTIPGGTKIILHKVPDISGYLEEFAIDYERSRLRFPVDLGNRCDTWSLSWSEKVKRIPKPEKQGVFFDAKRRAYGRELIGKMLECGEKAGIKDKMFLGFGGCLGYALCGDFLPTDDDIDMCIHSDDLTQEQLHAYLLECKRRGLTETRMRGPFTINGKYVWFSIGEKSIEEEHGAKACNWFWFNHGGYSWHSKGKRWIGRHGLNDEHPTAKGIPIDLTRELKTVRFGGTVDVQVPRQLGRCLDWWYPGWIVRKKESSQINTVLVIPEEKDKKTWYIEKRK